ncbi:MAG TPA: TIGR04053 family radical SAM/SPASM domain-containing protein [Bryobacteraceae bacterium]|nr:TIGR04053 family radical SAM/SPASM domain-containing protein [Bryobacteraceae bacterium]
MDFNQSPLLVIWEVTQACDLACIHCRASARPERDSGELSTEEGFRFLSEVKRFGNPLMVFTGGDPLKRPDIYDLALYSVTQGLRTNITPSATPLLTAKAVEDFQNCGISRMAISLDGPDAPSQDRFRQVPGTFDQAMAALTHARHIGLETQVQTTVTRRNLATLGRIAELVAEVQSKMWSLFFLVNTGCATEADDLTAEEYEKVFEFLYEISKVAPFEVKTTEGLHYRRYIAQRLKAEHGGRGGVNGRMLWRTTGVSDGRGFVFVSHTGEIFPSGFLPISAGNVRRDSIVEVYQNSSLFRILRDPGSREGKCGHCEYHKLCGGSRARAYALTGNYLEADPRCCYQPQAALEPVAV